MTTEDRPEDTEFEDGPITWTDVPKVIRERDMAAAALDAFENRVRLLLVTSEGDRADDEAITVAELRAAIGDPWAETDIRPSGHVANGAIALLASGLRNRDFAPRDADPQTVVSRALDVIDQYDTALAAATRDAEEMEGGLTVEQEIHDRALGHAVMVISRIVGQKEAWSVLGASSKVVAAVLEMARGFEPYIRDGAESSGVVS